VAFGNAEPAFEVWDVATGATGRKLHTLSVRRTETNILWFSQDGRWFATADCLGNVDMWDADTGVFRFTLSGHRGCITDMALSPDESTLAVLSWRGPLRLWDFQSGRGILDLPVGGWMVDFAPEGSRLIVAVYDPPALAPLTIRMYLLRTDELAALAKSRLTRGLTAEECRQFLRMETCPVQP
jgi:WD40 repeat protein